MWPGASAGRSGGDWEDGSAFFADVVATAWEVVVDWAGDDRSYAVLDLLSAVRRRARRQLLAQKNARTRVSLGLDERLHRVPATWSTTDLDLLAHTIDDLRDQGLHPADAAVAYTHHVLGALPHRDLPAHRTLAPTTRAAPPAGRAGPLCLSVPDCTDRAEDG